MTKSLPRKFRSRTPATDIGIARRYLGVFCPQDTSLDGDPEDRNYTPNNFVHIVSDQRPLITPLSLLLLLVRVLRPAGSLPLPQPPGLTRITCWDDHCATNMMALLQLHPAGVARSPWRVAAVQATGQPDRETDQDATLRQVRTLIESGKHVVLLSHADDPPHPALVRLCPQALTLPRPDRKLIMDLFTVLHSGAKAIPDVDALPTDAALAQLQTMELEIAFRQPDPAQTLDCLHRFTAPQGPNPAGGAAAPVLDQVRGQPEALATLKQIADDAARWASGMLDWHEVPRSALLYGPPGTGKTMLARALAGSTGLPLIVTSYAECQGSGEGHMGHMLAALNDKINAAIAQAPAILFIDELDGFGTRVADHQSKNAQYTRSVVTGLLRQIDRLMQTPGVILIAATNAPDAVDPAILRDGRFDLRIPVLTPAPADLACILRDNLPKGCAISDAVLQDCGRHLSGASGATAMSTLRKAAALARNAGRSVIAEDLYAVLAREHPALPDADRHRMAVHEVGHLIVGVLSDLPPPLKIQLGRDSGEVIRPALPFYTIDTARADLRILMAGRMAEDLLFGTPSSGAGAGPESDLAKATQLALRMETQYGLCGPTLIWRSTDPGTPHLSDGALQDRIEHHLSQAADEARTLLKTRKDLLEDIAQTLLQARVLQGDPLVDVIAQIKAAPAECTVGVRTAPGRAVA